MRLRGRRRVLGWFLAGGMLVVAGEALDHLEGIDGLFQDWARRLGVHPYTVGHAVRGTEELAEMVGITCVGQAFVRWLIRQVDGARVTLDATPPTASSGMGTG